MESLNLGKNDPCPCNSGKKFRQCCWVKRFEWARGRQAPAAPPTVAKTTVVHLPPELRPPSPTFWSHPPGQPDAPPPEGGEWEQWVFVKDKGWTHECDLKPGDQYRLKGGGWDTVPEPQTIRTTQEHPFYVKGKGWTPLCQIKPGDEVRGEEGWVTVLNVTPTNQWETVYNFRVADHHTYFVGAPEWGFSVWAHNAYDGPLPTTPPNGPKPNHQAAGAARWRYQRYGYDAHLKGRDPATLKDYQTWYKEDFLPAQAGGRPGRGGGSAQVQTRNRLQQEAGWEHSETHELGGHFPDLRRPNTRGGYDYAEVGGMTKGGKPAKHEYKKFINEAMALEPGQRLYFFDKDNPTRFVIVENNNGRPVIYHVNI